MKRSRFSDEQIIAVFKDQKAGMAAADVCRRHGVSSTTFYKRKAKYGGLEGLRGPASASLVEENARLKRLLAGVMLDNAMLKEIGLKKF
jgi:Transposase.